MTDISTDLDPAVFDAAALASIQRLISSERVDMHLRDLDREHRLLFQSLASDTSLQSQAHKIVSKAGMLGLTRMSECARALENACRIGDGTAAALLKCRTAAGDIRLFALPFARPAAD